MKKGENIHFVYNAKLSIICVENLLLYPLGNPVKYLARILDMTITRSIQWIHYIRMCSGPEKNILILYEFYNSSYVVYV